MPRRNRRYEKMSKAERMYWEARDKERDRTAKRRNPRKTEGKRRDDDEA